MKGFALILVSVFMLSGCASMQKIAGVPSEASVVAADTALADEITALKAQVEELSTTSGRIAELQQTIDTMKNQTDELEALQLRIDTLDTSIEEIRGIGVSELEEIKTLMADVQDQMDALPKESLSQLVRILSAALE
jgi:outer membrane murein-binding lipoprotein Lpp